VEFLLKGLFQLFGEKGKVSMVFSNKGIGMKNW
jgi:hypothetical protein